MRIMASTAPQPPIAIARTHTQGKLLDVADHPELCCGPRRHAIAVDGVRIFERCPGTKIAGLLTRVENLGDSEQVALLAYAVPRGALQLRRIYDGSRSRMRQVRPGISVAPVAPYSKVRKRRRLVLVFRSRHWFRASRMTKKAARGHRAREVRVGQRFVSRRQIITVLALVVGNGRLKKVVVDVNQVASGMFT